MNYLAWALIAAGAVGLYGRYSVAYANTAGSTGNVSSIANYDPALLILKIAPSGNFPDSGAFVDAAILAAGVWMLYRG